MKKILTSRLNIMAFVNTVTRERPSLVGRCRERKVSLEAKSLNVQTNGKLSRPNIFTGRVQLRGEAHFEGNVFRPDFASKSFARAKLARELMHTMSHYN